jgi:hypothetical protein
VPLAKWWTLMLIQTYPFPARPYRRQYRTDRRAWLTTPKLLANGSIKNYLIIIARYGIGGYMEHRTIYSRSAHFDTADEPRRLHLGVDIWGDAGTPIYSPLAGIVHSFADNDNFGDYGPCIILQHNLGGLALYSLYGHLSRKSLAGLAVGQDHQPKPADSHFGRRYRERALAAAPAFSADAGYRGCHGAITQALVSIRKKSSTCKIYPTLNLFYNLLMRTKAKAYL